MVLNKIFQTYLTSLLDDDNIMIKYESYQYHHYHYYQIMVRIISSLKLGDDITIIKIIIILLSLLDDNKTMM